MEKNINMQMTTLIFDFDYTLFDTFKFKQVLGRSLCRHGISENFFWQTYQQTVNRDKQAYNYNLDYQLEIIAGSCDLNREQARQDIGRVIEQAADFIYPEAEEVLKIFSDKEDFNLILLTLGNYDFQKAKVENSGLTGYFQEVVITSFSKVHSYHLTIPSDNKAVFVSDSLQEIFEVRNDYPQVMAILKIREDKDECFLPDNIYKIKNLLELKRIVH